MPISVVFDPPLPSDSPSTFNTKAFTLLGDLNDWSTQANALPGEVATNLTTLLASPPAIGGTTPAAGSFTTLSASGQITASGGAAAITMAKTTGASSRSDMQIQGTNSGASTQTYYFGVNSFGTDGSLEMKPPSGNGMTMTPTGEFIFDHVKTSGNQFKVRNVHSGASSDTTMFVHSTAGTTGVQSGTVLKVTGHPASVGSATGKVLAVGLSGGSEESYSPLLEVAYSGAVTIPGSVGIGVTPSASIGGGRELTVYGGVSIRGDSRYWYIDGKSGQDAMVIGLRASGDTVDTDAININSAGAVTIPGATSFTGGTFGYGVGAGGTVTQATSKSTAVTLNKPCGQITMNNAALAAGAVIAFSFLNNTVSVTDTVLFNVSGGTPDYGNYSVMGGVTPGAIGVYVKNLTVGSLSDALVINFAVIKGATA